MSLFGKSNVNTTNTVVTNTNATKVQIKNGGQQEVEEAKIAIHK